MLGSLSLAVRAGLAFLQTHLQLPLCADDPDVKAAGTVAVTARRGQAERVSPADLYVIGKLATDLLLESGQLVLGELRLVALGTTALIKSPEMVGILFLLSSK